MHFLSTTSAAQLINAEFFPCLPSDIERWTRRGDGPPYRMLHGTRRVYHPDQLRGWAATRLGPLVKPIHGHPAEQGA